jgi:putative tryptophan/tyrosine transport system substrate-binding protein
MQRRVFLAGMATVMAEPLRAGAQQAGKAARVGILMLTTRAPHPAAVEHLLSGLRELGYVEGETIVFEYRAAEGNFEHLPELARELAAARVDVIWAAAAPAALAAKRATNTIPVVFSGIPDPVGTGLVASLARPILAG